MLKEEKSKWPIQRHHCLRLGNSKPDWAGFLIGLVFLDRLANPAFVLRTVLLKEVVGLGLCRWLGVRVVQEILDAEQELLNSDGRSPTFLLIQDWQANCSGRVDIRVEKCWCEFAWTVVVLVWDDHERSKKIIVTAPIPVGWHKSVSQKGYVHLGGLVGYSRSMKRM